MRASVLLAIGLIVLCASILPTQAAGVNPEGIQSGLVEVLPLSANTGITMTWADVGIANPPYFGIALVDMSAASSVNYRIILTQLVVTANSAAFNVSLSGGWVKAVYRWIASKGEPLVTMIITLGSTASGPLAVALPFGTPSTYPQTSIEKVDTLIAGFDYTNAGSFTGINIQIKPVVPTMNVPYNDFLTNVNATNNQLLDSPITTAASGALTLNLQITLSNSAVLSNLIFTVILHTVAQRSTLTPDVVTGYAIPLATTSGVINILDANRNTLSVIDPVAIYGASSIVFPDNSQNGVGFKLELPQAQSISANFLTTITQLNIGVYMYALRYPCGPGGDVTNLFLTSTAGSWVNNGGNGVTTQFPANNTLYLEADTSQGGNTAMRLTPGVAFIPSHSYTIKFELSIPTNANLVDNIQVSLTIGPNVFGFLKLADAIPIFPAKKAFTIQVSNLGLETVQFVLVPPAGPPAGAATDLTSMYIINLQLHDNGVVTQATTNPNGVVTYTCATVAVPIICNPYMNPFVTPSTPLLPAICRDCTPNPITGTNGCSCPVGYYSNVIAPPASTCLLCQVSYCKSCTPIVGPPTPLTCVTCDYGRTVSPTTGQCVCATGTTASPLGPCITCTPSCATCTSALSCLTCKTTDGATPTNRVTTPNQGVCACLEGFFDNGVAVCSACNVACRTCSGNAGFCTSCKLNSNTALSGNACACLPGFTPRIPADGTCYKCDVTCATCQGPSQSDCLTCPGTRSLFSSSAGAGVCYCLVGFTEQNPRQADCIVGSCSAVTTGCTNCTTAGCSQCSESLNFNLTPVAGVCRCKPGYYFNTPTSTCVACGAGCLSCTSAGVCNSCYQGATQTAGGCACPNGTYANTTTLACVACTIVGCGVCPSNTCTGCISPWVYVSGDCKCPDQTYLANGACVNCPTGCRLCNNTGCNSCNSPNFLLNSACLSTCPDTFVGVSGVCLNCPTNCRTCSVQTTCTICALGFYLYAGGCVSICPANTLTNTTSMTCTQCSAPCSSCSNTTTFCTSCLPGSGFLLQGTCVSACPSMTTNVGGVCLSCNSNCATCFGSQDFCSSCAFPKFLFNGTCVLLCPPNSFFDGIQCVVQCRTGQYPSGTNCLNCSTGCVACTSPVTCTQCPFNFYMLSGSCVPSCPPNTFPFFGPSGGVCLTCLPNCLTCATPTVCSQCVSPQYQLINGNCVNCLGSSVADPITGRCVPCPANCVTCLNSTYCSQCNPSTLAVNGTCITCLSPCSTCANGVSSCSSCITGYVLAGTSCVQSCPNPDQSIINGRCQCRFGFLFNGICVRACPPGFGPDFLGVCVPCSQNCDNCSTSVAICTQCRVGYSPDPNQRSNCIQNAGCSYGQASASTFCVRLCDVGTFFFNGFCIAECPVGYVVNSANSGCVPRQTTITCQVGQVSYLGRCLSSCPSNTYVSGGSCLNCSLNCNSCANNTFCLNCDIGFYLSGGSCLQSAICAPPQLSLQDNCVISCPTGTYSTGSNCVRVCDDSLNFLNGFCFSACPNGLFSNGFACVPTCPAGQAPINGVCSGNSSTGCQPGSFLSGTNCLPCQSPCATCVGLATICTTCLNGIPVGGRCQTSNGGSALIVTPGTATIIGNQFEVGLNLNIPINSLSTAQLNQFFIVTVVPSSNTNPVQVFQWATNGGSVIRVLLQFASIPPSNTLVFFNLNVAALASAYAAIGVTDFSGANTQVSVSSATPSVLATPVTGLTATFARAQSAQRA